MNLEQASAKLKQTSPLRLTVSGDIGSGKSTFARHLADDLQIERIYIGALNREEAARRGLTIDEFNAQLTTDDRFDRAVDALQTAKSKQLARGIFEGRTAWHFVAHPTVRIFFKVSPQVSAERLLASDDATRDKYHSVAEVVAANEARKASEQKRYQTYYGIDAYDPKNFDLIIDTSNKTIEQVYEETVRAVAELV